MIMYGVVHKDFKEKLKAVLLDTTRQGAVALFNERNYGDYNFNLSKKSKEDGWKVYKFNVEFTKWHYIT